MAFLLFGELHVVPLSGASAAHAPPIPADPALQDVRFSLQGQLLGADGSATLTNAVDVELGT